MPTERTNWFSRLFSSSRGKTNAEVTAAENSPSGDERVIAALVSVIVAERRTTQGLAELDLSTESTQQLIRSRLLFLHSELERISGSVNISMPDLVGLEYTDGLAVNVENGSDVNFALTTYIHQVIEPLVMQGERVLHPARVVLSNELPAAENGGI